MSQGVDFKFYSGQAKSLVARGDSPQARKFISGGVVPAARGWAGATAETATATTRETNAGRGFTHY